MKDEKEAKGRKQKAKVKNNLRGTNARRDRFITCLIVNCETANYQQPATSN